jgi:hypothetical protein
MAPRAATHYGRGSLVWMMPPERTKILRDAFMKSMADPALLEDTAKNKLEITPVSGDELTKIAKAVIDQPPEVIERIKKILAQ